MTACLLFKASLTHQKGFAIVIEQFWLLRNYAILALQPQWTLNLR
jgi:hypothetical protein